MDAGRLNQSLILQRKSVTRDAMGGEVITWVDVVTVYAAAEPIRGNKYVALQQSESEISIMFTIYYRADIDATWRVKWRGTPYELDGPPIDPNGANQWLEIFCRTAQT